MAKKKGSSDAAVIGNIGAVGAAAVAFHGMTSKKWETWHTVFLGLSLLAAIMKFADA